MPHSKTKLAARLLLAATIPFAATPVIAASASFASEVEDMIRTAPAQGIYNKAWYNYETDILEAKKELRSDLARATDREDQVDAWVEYRGEVVDADEDYVKAMRKLGYTTGRVTIG